MILMVTVLVGGSCGSGGSAVQTRETSTSGPPAETLTQQVEALDDLVRESISQIGLDPAAARREVRDNSCFDVDGNGKNLRFYFDEPSHDRAVELLRALEDSWSTGEFELNEPEAFQDDGELVSLLAVSGPFSLEGWWFPASKELAIGGSTLCIDGLPASTTTTSTDPSTTDEPGSTSTTVP